MGSLQKTAAALVQSGRSPVPCKGKVPIMKGWQDLNKPLSERLVYWNNGHDPDVGVVCDNVLVALDVDIYDKKIAKLLYEWIVDYFDGAPFAFRVGQDPKFLIPLQIDGAEHKITSSVYKDNAGRRCSIELLAPGHKFMVDGIHETTGRPYVWHGAAPDWQSPTEFALDDLFMLFDYFDEIAIAEEWSTWRATRQSYQSGLEVGDDGERWPTVPYHELEAAIHHLPSKYADGDRDTWLDVIMAIHFETTGSILGRELARTWSMSGEWKNKEWKRPFNEDWNSLKMNKDGRKTITGATIFKFLKDEKITYITPADPDAVLVEPKKKMFDVFGVDDEYLGEIENMKFLYPGLLVSNSILTVIAASGSGKTAFFFFHVAPHLASQGYDVHYFDADSPVHDHKKMADAAKRGRFQFANPTTKRGAKEIDVLKHLQAYVNAGANFKKKIFIFDTLKKYVDLMRKESVKDFFRLMRDSTALGATVVLLGHKNKKDHKDGSPIFEGVGDVKSDSDDLIFFERFSVAEYPGMQFVSTIVDNQKGAKIRGARDPFTFTLDEDRNVEIVKYIEPPKPTTTNRGRPTKYNDDEILEIATLYLEKKGERAQWAIVEYIHSKIGASEKKVRLILSDGTIEDGAAGADGYNILWKKDGRTKKYFVRKRPEQDNLF